MTNSLPSKKILRWLHLSDFHLGKDGYAQERLLDQITSHVQEKAQIGFVPDLVLVTGDITQNATRKQYEVFFEFQFNLEEIFQNFLDRTWGGKFLVAPGNHDINRDVAAVIDRNIRNKDFRYFDNSEQGAILRQQSLLNAFEAFINGDSDNVWLKKPHAARVETLEVNGVGVGTVVVNTAWLSKGTGDQEDKGQLIIGRDFLKDGLEQIQECDVRLVLGHHPLEWLWANERQVVTTLLGKYHAIYLHGHLHEAGGMRVDGSGGLFLAVQAGAAFQAREGDIWKNGFLWGEWDGEVQELRLQPQVWSMPHQCWIPPSDCFPPNNRIEGTEWWAFPLPGQTGQRGNPSVRTSSMPAWSAPDGWEEINSEFLQNRRTEPPRERVLKFFDALCASME